MVKKNYLILILIAHLNTGHLKASEYSLSTGATISAIAGLIVGIKTGYLNKKDDSHCGPIPLPSPMILPHFMALSAGVAFALGKNKAGMITIGSYFMGVILGYNINE